MIRVFNHYVRVDVLRQALVDVALLLFALALPLVLHPARAGHWLPIAGPHALSLAVGVSVISSASGAFQQTSSLTLIQAGVRGLLTLLFALPLTYAAFALLPADFPDRDAFRLMAMFGVTVVLVRRAFVNYTGSALRSHTRVLVFGAGPAAQVVGNTLRASDPGAEIVGFVPGPNETELVVESQSIIGSSTPLGDIARQRNVDEIVVALTERRAGSMPLRQLLDCKLLGIKVYDLAAHFEKRLGQIRVDYTSASWLVFGDGFNQGWWRTTVKRLFDIVFASLLFVLASPVMLVTAVLIKLDSRGPVFYRQERTGLNGAPFMVIKFRSMRTDAEKDGKPRWATKGDDRITRVGRVIRLVRIDELPQLFNVLKGDMSLVGPRPERPFFVEQLTREIPFFSVRQSVKPGVTGWAQVRHQYGASVEDAVQKLQYDLYYVKNHSLLLDVIVLLETVGVVLTGKGAH